MKHIIIPRRKASELLVIACQKGHAHILEDIDVNLTQGGIGPLEMMVRSDNLDEVTLLLADKRILVPYSVIRYASQPHIDAGIKHLIFIDLRAEELTVQCYFYQSCDKMKLEERTIEVLIRRESISIIETN